MKYIFGRSIYEFMALRTLSIKEIKYKLQAKGIRSNLIDNYIQNNKEEYEVKCAKKIINKKQTNMEEIEIKNFLRKKGYREESINIAMQEE